MENYSYLEFEKPIAALEKQLDDLRALQQSGESQVSLTSEITALEKKLATLTREIYSGLSTWQRVQLSRHPHRPYTRDYLDALFPDFMELHGDRTFGEDAALMAGIATWFQSSPKSPRLPVMILGHQKGRTTKEKMKQNFGMAKPEGYRKAMRAMELAERARMPILTFIDTPGAYPGLETEERGQAQAIAESIRSMFNLTVPVASVVIGEGGSGGALAIGVANIVLMQEYATYSVISPEGCASILWNDSREAERASQGLKMTTKDLMSLGVIDGVIPEPEGGAQRNWKEAIALMRNALEKELDPWFSTKKTQKKKPDYRAERIEKFRAMGLDEILKMRAPKGTA
jgi:acetyl-CoA carboxylase carboxyl transferase subunit alpha